MKVVIRDSFNRANTTDRLGLRGVKISVVRLETGYSTHANQNKNLSSERIRNLLEGRVYTFGQ